MIALLSVMVLLLILDAYAFVVLHPFRWISLLYLLLLFVIYLVVKRFKISLFGFVFLALFVVFCNLGTLGLHSQYFIGIRFDRWVHALSGLVFGFVFYEVYNRKKVSNKVILTIISVMIIGIIHEINEYFFVLSGLSYINGSFLVGAFFDFYDSLMDLIYDFVGVLISLLFLRR